MTRILAPNEELRTVGSEEVIWVKAKSQESRLIDDWNDYGTTCCDCGLSHRGAFQLYGPVEEVQDDGTEVRSLLNGDDYQLKFAATRDELTTEVARQHKSYSRT
jgi:hypothetical protein